MLADMQADTSGLCCPFEQLSRPTHAYKCMSSPGEKPVLFLQTCSDPFQTLRTLPRSFITSKLDPCLYHRQNFEMTRRNDELPRESLSSSAPPASPCPLEVTTPTEDACYERHGRGGRNPPPRPAPPPPPPRPRPSTPPTPPNSPSSIETLVASSPGCSSHVTIPCIEWNSPESIKSIRLLPLALSVSLVPC